MEISVSYLALIISGIATAFSVLSYKTSYHSLHSNLEPVLIFVYVEINGTKTWMIENVGRGPALEITIYLGYEKDSWDKGIRFHPIPPGTRVECPYTKNCPKLGASYKSITQSKYHSICFGYVTEFNKNKRPSKWNDINVDTDEELRPRHPVMNY